MIFRWTGRSPCRGARLEVVPSAWSFPGFVSRRVSAELEPAEAAIGLFITPEWRAAALWLSSPAPAPFSDALLERLETCDACFSTERSGAMTNPRAFRASPAARARWAISQFREQREPGSLARPHTPAQDFHSHQQHKSDPGRRKPGHAHRSTIPAGKSPGTEWRSHFDSRPRKRIAAARELERRLRAVGPSATTTSIRSTC